MAVMFSLFTLLVAALATAQSLPSTCKSSNSQPNPVASQYPDDVTGTDNQTIVLMPIPYSVARAVIPQQYSILDSACRAVLPGFCAQDGVFPVRYGSHW